MIYMTISGGEKSYYISVNDNQIDAEKYLDDMGINTKNTSTNSNTNTTQNSNNSAGNNVNNANASSEEANVIEEEISEENE